MIFAQDADDGSHRQLYNGWNGISGLGSALLTSWRGRLHGHDAPCRVPAFGTMVRFLCLSGKPECSSFPFSDMLEILRNAGWTGFLIVLLGLCRQEKNSSGTRTSPALTAIALLYTGCLFVAAYSPTEGVLSVPRND